MRLAPEISLRPTKADGVNRPRSEVLIEDRPAGSVISGCVLEAAVRCELGWLLFVTDDTPDEELLTIHFLGPDGRLLDSARIGGPYATGSFSALRLAPPAIVHFRFIDKTDWAVELLDKPRPALPWWPDARGVWRGPGVTRHFRVRRCRADQSIGQS